MKIISVINYKGGVGKTTVVSNLATGFAKEGYRVLMIDLDPQASLTFSFMHPDEWERRFKKQKTIKYWYDDYLNKKQTRLADYFITHLEVNQKVATPLTLVASHTDLFEVQVELAQKLRGYNKRDLTKNRIATLCCLREALEQVKDQFDLVLIDCQPSFDLITQSAIVASDYYLVPTRLDFLSTVGVETLYGHINTLMKELNEGIRGYRLPKMPINIQPLGLISTMVEFGRNGLIGANREYEQNMQKLKAINLLGTKIRFNQTVMSSASNIPAILNKPSNESEKKIIQDLNELVREIADRLGEVIHAN